MTAKSPAFDRHRADEAVNEFFDKRLDAPAEIVAAAEILTRALARFRAEAAAFRDSVGDEAAADFARHEFNDIICELQDAVGPAVRTYNSLLRDKDAGPTDLPG